MGLGKTLTLLSLIASNKPCRSVSYTLVDDVGTSSAKKHKSGNKRVVSSPKTTLVVCPSSVLTTWIAQLEQHTRPGCLQVYLYHGERKKEVDLLLSHDIVLTTYKTLALEFSSSHSPLKEIEWLRVILDEAHVIKNFLSQQTKVVVELKAERRWVVTGTPIQNNSFDLYSLMAFLRFLPFSIKNYWQRLALMASISLRRMKGTHNGSNSLVGLPSRTIETCFVELFSEEREQCTPQVYVPNIFLIISLPSSFPRALEAKPSTPSLYHRHFCTLPRPSHEPFPRTGEPTEYLIKSWDNKMWDIAGDGFEPVDDMGILEVVNLSLDLL
ncbi:hypothetical protein KFK09_019515 [Dendrobium nobile]|uniref:Helicase ATP-binding domain-containing protein n=1 Tax=Dendrobium nobile TaxID=94219 RepID=A0A8T3AWX6_DENNO|nr:hypothetical protein KFK09_019515 [Dendrobium nobile]